MRLVIATTNPGKLGEIRELLAGLSIDVRSLADYSAIDAPDEIGTTFDENARQKALFYAAAVDDLTVAEDSGLEIDALGGEPGVHSARFGGATSSYPEKFALIYERLRGVPDANRTARFVCALAVANRGRIVFEARGTVDGLIAPEPQGTGGFGYDPILFYPPFGCTLAAAPDWKSSVSHRGKAFRQLRTFLEDTGQRSEVRG